MLTFKCCNLFNQMYITDFSYGVGDGSHLSFSQLPLTTILPVNIVFRHLRLIVYPLADNARLTLAEGNLVYSIFPLFDPNVPQIMFWYVEAKDYASSVDIFPTLCEYTYQIISA